MTSQALRNLLNYWRKDSGHRRYHEIESFGGEIGELREWAGTAYHPEATLAPYVGDLRNAKVFLLMLNPGYGPTYEVEEQYFIGRSIKNLLHIGKQRFWPVDGKIGSLWCGPETHYSKYWCRMLKPVAERLGDWMPISEKFAMLNLIPYRSTHFKETRGVWETESCRLVRKFAEDDLARRTSDTLVIVARRPRVWALNLDSVERAPGLAEIICFSGVECRGIHLHGLAPLIAERLSAKN